MLRARWIWVLGLAPGFLALWLVTKPSPVVYSQSTPGLDGVISVRVQLGVTDREPRAWEGKLSAAGGEIVAVRHWRPRPGDAIEGTTSFKLATRQGVLFQKRPWEPPFPEVQAPYVNVPGLIVDVKGGGGTRVRFSTNNGSFEVAPFALRPGVPQTLLGGTVVADRVAHAQTLSGNGEQADFATLAGGGGELLAAWVSYRDGASTVMARRWDGRAWAAPQAVSEGHKDVHVVRAARDAAGGYWLVWTSQQDGNWDVYARRWAQGQWSGIERLSDDAQPDIYPAVAADGQGVWVVWQGFRNGKSDIQARRFENGRWQPAERVSPSPANDWSPAVAASARGGVTVVWDTYDQGQYDVVMRRWEDGRWSEVIPVANTPRFEAYPSVAHDGQGRVWVAWNESGFEWGKDTGFLPKQQGTALYSWRTVSAAVWENGQWKSPPEFEGAMPEEFRGFNDLPVLEADAAGRVWLLFRHRKLRIRNLPGDTPAHRAAWEIFATAVDGDRWITPVAAPFSGGRQDMRIGALGGKDGLYVAYPTDRRDYEDYLFRKMDVMAARVPLPATAAPVLTARGTGKLETPLIHANEAAELARVRGEEWTVEGKRYRIYRGDTHRHTEISMDGNNDGSLLDAYRYAIDAASLDYLMVSEHNGAGGPDVEYVNWLLQQTADLFTLPGTFLPLFGYERSLGYPNGHRNVIFATRGNPTLPIPPAEQKAQTGAQALYAYLKKYGGIAISHTSATNMGTDWRDNDPEVEPLVEIYQGDRVSAEYEGAPKAAYAGNLASAPGGFRPAGYVWNAWAKGYKLGVQASSDHLSTHISYACTIATEFTRQGLLEAMKLRHSYGATDNIVLNYQLEAGGRKYLQGEAVKVAGPFNLAVEVKGTRPVRQVDIIRGNKFVYSTQPMQAHVSFRFADGETPPGETYYYVRVQQVDEQMAWSSPIWVQR